jgi:adenosyl cobinamide kinase/adenosyl cobinamide phosphate guanylyltransferase
MALTLLLGGARSGKSALAQRMGEAWDGPVVVVATTRPDEAGMAERIRRHRATRPAGWRTVEEPIDLAGALGRAPETAFVLIDCLTVWTSNLLGAGRTAAAVETEAVRVAELAGAREARTVAVSNEVGMGVHPVSELGRAYRDVLGRVNAAWAGAAAEPVLVVAGHVLPLLGPDGVLGPLSPDAR